MKLLALLPLTAYANNNCDAPPSMPKGQWICPSLNQWNNGDVCRIEGDGCSGTIRCNRGRWRGKTSSMCPKDCPGQPSNPKSGGHWECYRHWSDCQLVTYDGFTCTTAAVCNTRKGRWTGKTNCRYTDPMPGDPPPARPGGEYQCATRPGRCVLR